jgi:hypothetical protein
MAMATIWFGFVDNDWLDRRPVQRVLFLGHSYTYYNDMPSMVVAMADSAGSPVRYDIVMHAFPNASLENHWHDRRTQSLLAQHDWDKVIIQPETCCQLFDPDSSHFLSGGRLLDGAGRTRPAIVASWAPSEAFYSNLPISREEHLQNIGSNNRALASQTGGQLINVVRVWEDVLSEDLPFSLYEDGNHPSLYGSYLAALVIYAEIAKTDVANVTYVPWGMSADDAALLRDRAQRSLRARGMAGFADAPQGPAASAS